MNDIFPSCERRTWTRPIRTSSIRLDVLSFDQRIVLQRMITGPAVLSALGWIAGGKVLASEAMRTLISDQFLSVIDATEKHPRLSACLTPKGRAYARECLAAVPPDVPGKAITPAG